MTVDSAHPAPSPRARLVFCLLLGALSTLCAEVTIGASPLVFFDAWGLAVVFPLYTLHILVLAPLVLRRPGGTSFPALYLAGVLFGLYEAYITKVLWNPPWDMAALRIGDVAVTTTLMIACFWHPFMAFITPLLLAERTAHRVHAGTGMHAGRVARAAGAAVGPRGHRRAGRRGARRTAAECAGRPRLGRAQRSRRSSASCGSGRVRRAARAGTGRTCCPARAPGACWPLGCSRTTCCGARSSGRRRGRSRSGTSPSGCCTRPSCCCCGARSSAARGGVAVEPRRRRRVAAPGAGVRRVYLCCSLARLCMLAPGKDYVFLVLWIAGVLTGALALVRTVRSLVWDRPRRTFLALG